MDEAAKARRRKILEAAVTPKGCGGPSPLERVLNIKRNPLVAPEWVYWPRDAQVEQWQAVALSLGLSPDSIQHSELYIKDQSFPTEEIQIEYKKRLELVRRLTESDVATLEYFAELLKSLPMPNEMAAMVTGTVTSGHSVTADTLQPSQIQPSTVDEVTESDSRQQFDSGIVIHRVETRKNILTEVINSAIEKVGGRDVNAVWARLVEMAESKNKLAPLLGFAPEGIQYAGKKYQAEGEPDFLTKKALRDRLDRLAKSR